MIYSKRLNDYIPVKIETQTHKFGNNETFTRYLVKDNRITIGRVDLIDTANGVEVQYIENYHNQLYSNFGKIADQLEVEHCLKRGLDKFEINSYGSLNSHALHYIRGKRFFADEVNNKLAKIIANTPKGEKFDTKFLGKQKMYMPLDVIKKHLSNIVKNPLLK